jgi:hypothetical protein
VGTNTETWFEVKVNRDLALLLQRIVNVHTRIGRARQAGLRARIAAAIPDRTSPNQVNCVLHGPEQAACQREAAGLPGPCRSQLICDFLTATVDRAVRDREAKEG